MLPSILLAHATRKKTTSKMRRELENERKLFLCSSSCIDSLAQTKCPQYLSPFAQSRLCIHSMNRACLVITVRIWPHILCAFRSVACMQLGFQAALISESDGNQSQLEHQAKITEDARVS